METRRPIVIPSALSNRLWARARARGDVSWVIVCSRRSRCVSSRGCTYRTVGTLSCGVASETKVWITLYTSRYYAKKLLVRHLIDGHNKTILIAPNVEDHTIIAHNACIAVHIFDVCRRFPGGGLAGHRGAVPKTGEAF